jgi:hypothetical protein
MVFHQEVDDCFRKNVVGVVKVCWAIVDGNVWLHFFTILVSHFVGGSERFVSPQDPVAPHAMFNSIILIFATRQFELGHIA